MQREETRQERKTERIQKDMERHAFLSAKLRKTVRSLSKMEGELRRIEKRRGL